MPVGVGFTKPTPTDYRLTRQLRGQSLYPALMTSSLLQALTPDLPCKPQQQVLHRTVPNRLIEGIRIGYTISCGQLFDKLPTTNRTERYREAEISAWRQPPVGCHDRRGTAAHGAGQG